MNRRRKISLSLALLMSPQLFRASDVVKERQAKRKVANLPFKETSLKSSSQQSKLPAPTGHIPVNILRRRGF